jgi:hypothetical protein
MIVFPRALSLALLAYVLCAVHSHAQVVISEFMAGNVNTNITDEDGNREDWIELQNNGTTTVSLNGWYLTDDASDKRKWQFPVTSPAVNLPPGGRILVWASNKNRKLAVDRLHTNFALNAAGEYLALIRPDGLTAEYEFAPVYPPQATDVSYGLAGTKQWNILVGPPRGSQWKVRTPQSATDFTTTMSGWHNTLSFDDATWSSAGMGMSLSGIPLGMGYDVSGESSYLLFAGAPTGNLQSLMYKPNNAVWPAGTAPTLAARVKFDVANPAQIEQMRLNIRFDDGFVVYLNGTKILENNAPASPAWNSAAPIDRQDDQLEDFETFALPLATGALVAGQNLLTIHAFNEANVGTSASAVFHLTPQLEVFTATEGAVVTLGYLATATPGGENTIATSAIGPDIAQTTKNPPQPVGGAGSAPLLITSRVRPTLNPVASVTCRYIVNFGSELSVPMRDDGTGGDVTAGDGIFSASIPTNALSAGHFIRWRILATDTASPANQAIDPPYRDSYDNDQYFGTMAQTPTIQSQLPILYWFHNSSSTAPVFSTNKSGFRSSLFYKLPTESFGRYYDNVRFNVHGQSTSSFAKKSQNVNFNKDNRFTWRAGESEIRGMNLLSNWADKTHVRNSLAWDTWNLTRHPSHWSQMVRVQQVTAGNLNQGVDAQFLCITDMVEDANKEFFERWGLDPDGAMYKMYNSLENTSQNSSTNGAGVEKKTREWEDFSDLQALVNAMDPARSVTDRRRYVYDNVDVPAMINYLAVHNLIMSHDFGHKNYYVYRDTNGTGEWKLIPWDQDLSFGHRWTSAQNYFDDDLESARDIFIGGGGNRLMRIVNTSGATEFHRMYVRRLRTLMDKYYGHPTTPSDHFASRIDFFQDLIDPANWPVTTDAERDFRKWGFWVDGSGSPIAWTDARAVHHRIRPSAVRVKTTNDTSIYPGVNPYSAYGNTANIHSSLNPFIPGRRSFLYGQIAGAVPSLQGQAIPNAQSPTPSLGTVQINANVAGSTDQEGEYFILRNLSTSEDLDISDWTVSGAIDFTFPAGTVLPRSGTSTSDGTSAGYVNQIVVAKNPARFRARTTAPKGNEFRLVVGEYDGQLSARGGTLQFKNAAGAVVYTDTYPGAPTAAQQSLRITELNYAPLPPSAAESAALPGVSASEFEFIELINTGTTALSLGNAQFDKGITFSFPAGYTLAAGERMLIVSNQAAFALRYGTTLNVAGQYEGNLSNSGERLRLLDSVGEVVLDFTYSPSWYPPTGAGGGYSLVIRTTDAPYDQYGLATNWAISGQQGGTPDFGDISFSETFEGWRHDYFSPLEQSGPAAAAVGDFEGDGCTNLAEYAFGQDPKQPAVAPLTTPGVTNIAEADYMTITFIRRKQAIDLSYVVEATSDFVTWTPTNLTIGAPVAAGVGLETVTFRDAEPRSNAPRYMRVRALKP